MTHRGLVERISPLWLGIGISTSLLVILAVAETVQGRWDGLLAGGDFNALASVSGGILRDLRIAIVHCLIIGYLPAALLHVLRSGRRTVLVLQDSLNCTREECEALATSVRLSTPGLIITAFVGLALAFVSPYLVPPVPPAPWSPSTWSAEVVWHRLLGPGTMVLGWWLGYAIVSVSVRLSRIATRISQIDLLDLSPLAPFTKLGLTNALLPVGYLSIWSLMLLEEGFGQLMWMVSGATLVLASLSLMSPVRGVHRRILQSKEAELGWVNDAIADCRNAFQGRDIDPRTGEMADLIAYRNLVEGVPEWPFTTSTYTRLFLYALLPVASWTIGVIAEEIVGRAFS